jgi:hypothetical protein
MTRPSAKIRQKGLIPRCIPKKANKAKEDWTENHCSLCKKHGSVHITHNTKECRHYNSDRNHKKAISKPKSD